MTDTTHSSPFHRGEQAAQQRLGVREQMERFGSRVIRDYMPDQHREFYGQSAAVHVVGPGRRGASLSGLWRHYYCACEKIISCLCVKKTALLRIY
jgi:hypothetical protein